MNGHLRKGYAIRKPPCSRKIQQGGGLSYGQNFVSLKKRFDGRAAENFGDLTSDLIEKLKEMMYLMSIIPKFSACGGQ